MRKKSIKIFVVFAAILIGTSSINPDKLFEISKNIEVFVKVYKELNTNYVDDLDPAELMRIGLDAMVNSLDPYTNYISESQVESYRLSDEGQYKGIGATLDEVDGIITIIEPFDGSPAQKAGLRAGDQLTIINGLVTSGKKVEDIDRVVRGVPGTEISLQVYRPSEKRTFDVNIVRSSVDGKNVPYYGMVKDGIGYIKLTTFTPEASKNIASALQELKKENNDLKGIILDLRFNGGGLLREAIAVSNIFIPKGQEVVTTKGKVIERDQSYRTFNTPVDLDIPLAVLINKKSASASEIVAGVVQDLDRGILVGQRSYGKGLVQNTVNIAYNNRLKMTTSKYYIPSRRCIQSVEYEHGEPVDIPDDKRSKFKTRNGRTVLDGGGITPDVKMPDPSDSPLMKALKEQHLIFKYVNNIVSEMDSVKNLDAFEFNGYNDFKKYVEGQNFSFTTDSEKSLETLNNTLDKDFLNTQFEINTSAILQQIKSNKQNALDRENESVIGEIEKEIISRFFAQSGRIQFSLLKDNEIIEAIDILNNPSRYQEILGY